MTFLRQSMASEVITMVMANQGLKDLESVAAAQAHLSALLDDFVAARQVVTMQYPPVTPEQREWELNTPFDVEYMLNGVPSVRQATQLDYAAEFISMIQIALNMSVDEFTMDNRVVYYIVQNDDTLHDTFETSMDLRFEKFSADYSTFGGLVRGWKGFCVVCLAPCLC